MRRGRHIVVERLPPSRQLVIAGFRAGRRRVPMYGLLDLDVTAAKQLMESVEPRLSMTAFVIASVARAAAAHPAVHAYRNWRGKLVTHRFVDVATMVEVPTSEGPFALVHTVQDADTRTVADLSLELREAKGSPTRDRAGRFWIDGFGPALAHFPGAVRALYAVINRSVAIRQRVGTVAVTAVGMFAGGAGFGLTPLTLMSCEVIVGGMSRRPRVVDGDIQIRDVLDVTLVVDHTLVDGAPAARFAAALRELIETAAVLKDPR